MRLDLSIIFVLVWSAFFLCFDGMMAHGIFIQFNSRHYPSATATVTHLEKGGPGSQPRISYRFEVGGLTFASQEQRFANSPNSDQADSLAAHAVGSTIQVYYNPKDPRQSLLFPGVSGADFLTVLLLTPFNACSIGIWMWIGGQLRVRLFRPPAGGVRILADSVSTRARLPQYGAAGWGLQVAGGLGLVSAFIIGFCVKTEPSVGMVLTLIAAVYLAGVGAWLWRRRKIDSGIEDLVITQAGRTLELPRTFGRQKRLSVGVADIEGLTVKEVVHFGFKGGRSYTYEPTLHLRGAQAGEQKLAVWSDKVKADDFADWLRLQLAIAPCPECPEI
jgi:hypothetical protein